MNRSRSLKSRAEEIFLPMSTSMEMLDISPSWYRIAIIPYHHYVVVGIWHGNDRKTSALYRFASASHSIEDPLNLVYLNAKAFNDMGEAVKDAINKADELLNRKVV